MTTIKVIFLGMMLVWMPSLILLAYLLWREGVGHRTDGGDRLRSLFLSHGLEFEINHLIRRSTIKSNRPLRTNRQSRKIGLRGTRRSFRRDYAMRLRRLGVYVG